MTTKGQLAQFLLHTCPHTGNCFACSFWTDEHNCTHQAHPKNASDEQRDTDWDRKAEARLDAADKDRENDNG
jgi:hypothetical protein